MFGSPPTQHTNKKTTAIVTLGEMGDEVLRFRCDHCQRKGQYKASTLMGIVGDITPPAALVALAQHARCQRALSPPSVNDINYNTNRCQIRYDRPPPEMPPTIGKAMHEHWRGFIRCARHHQGLKATKPCNVEAELDLATLVAALGYDFEIRQLNGKLSAPCCGSRSFELRWYRPAAQFACELPRVGKR